MRYEKATAEVVKFEFSEFMMGSALVDGHCDEYKFPGALGEMGYSCSGYDEGTHCDTYHMSQGTSCTDYNGSTCGTYTAINGGTYYNVHQNCNHF